MILLPFKLVAIYCISGDPELISILHDYIKLYASTVDSSLLQCRVLVLPR